MASSNGQHTHDEQGVFQYIDWQDVYLRERPYQVFSAVPEKDLPEQMSTNLIFKDGPLEPIRSARGNENAFNLDQHGFAFCRHSISTTDFADSRDIENHYLPAMEDVLRQNVDDVDQVYIFDWRIRKNIEIEGKGIIDANDKMQHLLPARHVHLDQAPSAVVGRTRLHLPHQADFLLRGRVRIINVWRPLVDVIQDRPLAVCDASTIKFSDLVEADHVRKHYNGSNYYAKPSPDYRWYYLDKQTKDEITLLKIFDSDPGKNIG